MLQYSASYRYKTILEQSCGKRYVKKPLNKQSVTKRFMCIDILNMNVIVAQQTVTKSAFLRHNRCIELGKRYVALH